MIETWIDRRGLAMLAGLALLAGCKVIPKGPPKPPPAPTPEAKLPSDGRHRVAVLVPLTGPNAVLGQSIANATTMALLDTNARAIRLTIYNTATGPGEAASQAIRDGNRLILGPLENDDVAPVAAVARGGRVPLLTFAGDSAAAAKDVFVLGVTPDNAIDRVVNLAHARGSRRFALLAPKGDYGARATSAYAAALRAAGGTLVGSESYDRSNTSIVSAAQRLKARGGFDAVLIADSARLAALAAPRLRRARILGTDLWSRDASINKSVALRGAWFPALPDNRFAQFSASYKARFGNAPYRQATLGYDSVLLTVRISREWRVGTPFPVARMLDKDGYLGLDGPFRFAASGQGERALEVREVRTGGITIVSPAPERFAD
jgi:ABC-type branched-subunit amino acid transport system substrate-binding protein